MRNESVYVSSKQLVALAQRVMYQESAEQGITLSAMEFLEGSDSAGY